MLLMIMLDVIITAGLAIIGGGLGFLLVLIGLPAWLLWFMPAWFAVGIPLYRILLGGYDLPASRRGRHLGRVQRPIASHPRRREPRLEDVYP